MNKPKLEVGDRVIWNGKNAKIIRVTPLGRYVVDVGDTSVMTYGQNLKKLEEKDMEDNTQAITIIRDGNKTLAIYTSRGGMTDITKTAVARCHPDDEYDFEIGSDIAYSRLMGFPEVSKAAKKENEQLKERIRDLEISNTSWAENFAQLKRNKDTAVHNLGEEKANLKEQLSKQKEINKELVDEHAELIRDYAHATNRIDDLEEQLSKQKEINKELVDENEKSKDKVKELESMNADLTSEAQYLERKVKRFADECEKLEAEIEKLKPSNKEIKVCDTVEIVNSKACYSLYEEWIDKYLPKFANQWNEFHDPKNGDIGIVMAKAKHYRSGEMLYAVLIGEKVYIMGKEGIKLHNR